MSLKYMRGKRIAHKRQMAEVLSTAKPSTTRSDGRTVNQSVRRSLCVVRTAFLICNTERISPEAAGLYLREIGDN